MAEKIQLGSTDLKVSALCMGTAGIGSTFNSGESFKLLDRYAAMGGNFLDTAQNYADWACSTKSVSEKTIGAWLACRRCANRMVIATKIAQLDANTGRARLKKEQMQEDLEASLIHLGTDCIDLLWMHRDDPNVDVHIITEFMQQCMKKGLIRAYGCSNWTTPRVAALYDKSQSVAGARNGFCANQPMWGPAVINAFRISDPTMVAMDVGMYDLHQTTGLCAVPYSSQAGGYFEKLLQKKADVDHPLYGNVYNMKRLERIMHVAEQNSYSCNDVCIAYMQSQPFPTVPIIGFSSLLQLEQTMRMIGVRLSSDEVVYLQGETPVFQS